uniref:Uncharacterized protein n=1 Tax=Cacopsylla melanoneura TaxID=428564 RepID=A0A8D9EKG0_9HEMI
MKVDAGRFELYWPGHQSSGFYLLVSLCCIRPNNQPQRVAVPAVPLGFLLYPIADSLTWTRWWYQDGKGILTCGGVCSLTLGRIGLLLGCCGTMLRVWASVVTPL